MLLVLNKELDRCFDMALTAKNEDIRERAERRANDLTIQKRDLQAELQKISNMQCLKDRTIEDIMGRLQFIFAINDIGVERRKRLINTLISCVVVFDGYIAVTLDENGAFGKMDSNDWKDWYSEIDWAELTDGDDDDDPNGGGSGGCGDNGGSNNGCGHSNASGSECISSSVSRRRCNPSPL